MPDYRHLSRSCVTATLQLSTRECEIRRFRETGRFIFPYLTLLRIGFTPERRHRRRDGVLLPSFHPYLSRPCKQGLKAVCFCSTFPVFTDGGCYPQSCPVETGLSSFPENRNRGDTACLACYWVQGSGFSENPEHSTRIL